MTIPSILSLSLLGVAGCAVAQEATKPVIACNPKAMSAADRPRYNDLAKRLRAAVRSRTELPDGYRFNLDGKTITLPEAAEWVTLELLCCPFLIFQLSATGDRGDWLLTLTGPSGAKEVLENEFTARGTGSR